jgi:hypothetical protein
MQIVATEAKLSRPCNGRDIDAVPAGLIKSIIRLSAGFRLKYEDGSVDVAQFAERQIRGRNPVDVAQPSRCAHNLTPITPISMRSCHLDDLF